MRINRGLLLGLLASMVAGSVPRMSAPKAVSAGSERGLLSGTIKSALGQKMNGVTVSAKAEGQTITTSVFTDESGDYYFPGLKAGRYRVWAQADGFGTGRSEADLNAMRRKDFILLPIEDVKQELTGVQLLAAIPDRTPSERSIK